MFTVMPWNVFSAFFYFYFFFIVDSDQLDSFCFQVDVWSVGVIFFQMLYGKKVSQHRTTSPAKTREKRNYLVINFFLVI